MKAGDWIRFRYPLKDENEWFLGLCIEYTKWTKVAVILYKGDLIRIPARDTQLVKALW